MSWRPLSAAAGSSAGARAGHRATVYGTGRHPLEWAVAADPDTGGRFSGSDTGDTGNSDFSKISELLSGDWPWLEGQLGLGGTPAGRGQITASS
jgi:hypothetical protein